MASLRWSALNAAALKRIPSSSLLEGLDLYDNREASPASVDLIWGQCPNLRYFSVDFLNGEQMQKLPLNAPNLQYLRLSYMIGNNSSRIIWSNIDDLTYVVENLPDLRHLCISNELYDLLRGHEPIKRLC
uniref:Uncharacterized protein n=1 Tax=Romanomermis culicivorax TaxID=13658 RepID=A0A915HUV8_ROMCU